MKIIKLTIESGIFGKLLNRHKVIITCSKNWSQDVYQYNGALFKKIDVIHHTTKNYEIKCDSFDEAVELYNAINDSSKIE